MKPAPRATTAVDAAFFVLVVLVPLVWSKALVAEFTLPKFVALNTGLLIAAWAAAARPDALSGGVTALDRPLAALLALAALSAAFSDDPRISFLGRYDSYVHGVWGMALIAAAAQFAARGARGREEFPVRLLSWAGVLVGGYAVIQKLGWDPVFRIQDLPTGARAVSSLGSPVDLGAYLALLTPVLIWRADAERGAATACALALTVGGLLASGSRGAMVAAAAGAGGYALMSRRDPVPALRRALALAVLLVTGAAVWASRAGASASDRGRLEVWKTALHLFQKRPWLGWGPDGFEEAFKIHRTDAFIAVAGRDHYQAYAHNDFLHVLSGLGLAGAAAYAWLLAALLLAASAAFARPANRRLAAALTAGLIALWVNLELNPVSLEVWTVAAVVAGLLASLSANETQRTVPRAVPLVLAVLLGAGVYHTARSAVIDAEFKRGLKAHNAGDLPSAKAAIARVRLARPCELSYVMGEINCVTDWINADHTVEHRLALLELADRDGREAIACHPRLSIPHYIAGNAARMHYDLGFKNRLTDAAREFDAALALDPKFGPLLDARAAVTRLQSAR